MTDESPKSARPKPIDLAADVHGELQAAKVQLQLIGNVVEDALAHGAAFGSELRLALRIKAILEHKL